jgi:putative CocE/NonD family hydrolase
LDQAGRARESQPPLRVDDARVPMRDGVHLAADVLRIDDGRPRPVLLLRTPYSRAAARAAGDVLGIARDGWVVVCQDVRGRFDSDGRFMPFQDEAADGCDTVQWCAAQPWCDGRVAMSGGSYLGAAQLLCAMAAPPALGAVAPMLTPVYDQGWCGEGGAMLLGLLAPWLAGFAAAEEGSGPAPRRDAQRVLDDPDGAYAEALGRSPMRDLLTRFPAMLQGGDPADLDLVASGRRVTVPGFHVGGWYDAFCEHTLRAYTALRSGAGTERARLGQRLVMGPWTHFTLLMRLSGEIDFGAEAAAPGLPAEMLAWSRRVLDGEDVEGDARVFVMGENRWRVLPSWPPPASPLRLHLDSGRHANSLHGDGRLQLANPAETRADQYRYDPSDPVPSRGGRGAGPHLPPPGPCDQRPVEERADVLVYTSDRLPRALTVMGEVTASICFASSAMSADVTVKLVEVHADGRAINLVDSVRRTALVPGEPARVEVAVGSTAIVVAAGHRLRVEVSSSNFPRLDRNPSTGEPAATATVLRPASQTVLHGGDHPSWVELPIVADG